MLLKIMRRKEWILRNYTKTKESREKPIRKSNVHVVIDCIKNVFEAEYLKVRYHSFYLVALTLDDDIRRQRLSIKKGLNNFQMEVIDTREQPSKAKKLVKEFDSIEKKTGEGDYYEKQTLKLQVFKELFGSGGQCSRLYKNAYEKNTYTFNLQDVDGCIQNADILINNGASCIIQI